MNVNDCTHKVIQSGVCTECGYEQGRKDDKEKIQWTLLPMEEIKEVIRVLMKGAEKYAAWNWQKVENAEDRYLNAAYRHMAEIAAGNKTDPEWGFSHYAHAICSLLFAAWHSKQLKDRITLTESGMITEFCGIRVSEWYNLRLTLETYRTNKEETLVELLRKYKNRV